MDDLHILADPLNNLHCLTYYVHVGLGSSFFLLVCFPSTHALVWSYASWPSRLLRYPGRYYTFVASSELHA